MKFEGLNKRAPHFTQATIRSLFYALTEGVAVAKRRKKKRSTAAINTNLALAPRTGPSFSEDAILCLAATSYNIREQAMELAEERACGKDPIPEAAVKMAFVELGLNWALETDGDT